MKTELEYKYWHYYLKLRYPEDPTTDFCQVTMLDYLQKRPLIWSTGMTKAQANGAIQLFKAIGYFDMPV